MIYATRIHIKLPTIRKYVWFDLFEAIHFDSLRIRIQTIISLQLRVRFAQREVGNRYGPS
jgi:hypothetical protein